MYTIHARNGLDYVNTSVAVEGLRDGWQDRVVGNYHLLRTEKDKDVFKFALRVLLAEFTPSAYLASEPVIRFEAQLREVIARICEE